MKYIVQRKVEFRDYTAGEYEHVTYVLLEVAYCCTELKETFAETYYEKSGRTFVFSEYEGIMQVNNVFICDGYYVDEIAHRMNYCPYCGAKVKLGE